MFLIRSFLDFITPLSCQHFQYANKIGKICAKRRKALVICVYSMSLFFLSKVQSSSAKQNSSVNPDDGENDDAFYPQTCPSVSSQTRL